MSCIQVAPCQLRPSISVSKNSSSSGLPSKPCTLQIPSKSNKPVRASLMLAANALKYSKLSSVSKYKHRTTVCLFAGNGMSDNKGSEGSQWKPLENDAGSLEKKSIEEILREQIEKKEYAPDPFVGNGGKRPRGRGDEGGGGSGSGGGRDRGRGWGSGDPEPKEMPEGWQRLLATLGFALVYLTTILGEDAVLLARDYIRFLSTGNRTTRLRKAMEWPRKAMEWSSQMLPGSRKRMTQKKSVHEIDDEDNDEDEYAYQ